MGPEVVLAAVLLAALVLYAVLGGADFGAGVWEFNTVLMAPREERNLLYRAIGPVWEANHVWLIFALVVFWTAFPPAFAAACRALWLPLLLALAGIVFRGAGYAFRSHAAASVRQEALWSAAFALGATAAPFFLGACLGAAASDRLSGGWLTSMSVYAAFYAVAASTYLSAAYLVREARLEGNSVVEELWRRRALACGIWMGILTAAGLAVLAHDSPGLWARFVSRAGWLAALSVIAGLGSIAALLARRPTAAALAAAGAVATVLVGLGVARYPSLVGAELTIQTAAAPRRVLVAMLWGIGLGSAALIPSLVLLFRIFKSSRRNRPEARSV